MGGSFRNLWESAHPNSAIRRRFPDYHGDGEADVAAAIAYEEKHPRPARDNTGFEDDWAPVLWDLGANLPDGHPFAPVVDGRAAA